MKYIEFFAGLLGSAGEVGVPDNQVNIMSIINLALWAAGVIAVVIVIIAGINYSLSSGDPTKTANAKNAYWPGDYFQRNCYNKLHYRKGLR